MNDPTTMRRFILIRDKHTCQECNTRHVLVSEFEIDHIKPLYESYGDASYFSPDNAQLLCIGCHKKKTKVDLARWRTYFKENGKQN